MQLEKVFDRQPETAGSDPATVELLKQDTWLQAHEASPRRLNKSWEEQGIKFRIEWINSFEGDDGYVLHFPQMVKLNQPDAPHTFFISNQQADAESVAFELQGLLNLQEEGEIDLEKLAKQIPSLIESVTRKSS